MSRRITTTPEAYNQLADDGVPGTYRAATADADAVDLSSADNNRFALRGNPTIAVNTWFTGAEGDTVEVTVILYHYDGTTHTVIGVQTATATAGAYTNAGGDNYGGLLLFDSGGANAAEVRLAAPSAGTVAAMAWAYGSEPIKADA